MEAPIWTAVQSLGHGPAAEPPMSLPAHRARPVLTLSLVMPARAAELGRAGRRQLLAHPVWQARAAELGRRVSPVVSPAAMRGLRSSRRTALHAPAVWTAGGYHAARLC